MKKKGFTLIELLAVVIVLAVIAVIAIPITLDVIEDTRKSADKSSANMVLAAAKNYYAESWFDETKKSKMNGAVNIFDELVMENKPSTGEVYINEEGQVAVLVVLGDTAYVKQFGTNDFEEKPKDEDIFVGVDENLPTVDIEINTTTPDIVVDTWYTEAPTITIIPKDEETGVNYYEYCQGIDCEPNIVGTSESVTITDSKETQICVVVYDKAGNKSEKKCTNTIMVDTIGPEISGVGDLVVQVNEQVDLAKDVIVTDATSGVAGSFSTNPTSVNTSKTGTYEVVYRVVDNAGNITEVTRKIIVSANAPTINYTVAEGIINENGWAKENFFVTINVKDNTGQGLKEFKVCTSSTDTCDPTNGSVITDSTTATREIIQESANNRICVQATDNDNQTSEVICSDAYKLDKTKPTVGTINITGDKGANDWYTSNVTITTNDGSDTLSGHLSTTANPTSITENTEGTKIIVTTTDKAGNTATSEYTIKVDKTTPTATINRTTSDNKNVLTATINPSDNLSGYSYQWYKGTTAIIGATNISYTTSEAGTYKLEVTTGSGKVVSSNEIEIKTYTITYNLNGGTGNITNTTKVEDINTTITSSVPTRSGYTFVGWGTSASDKTSTYASNALYTTNENKTLYAIWKKGYTLTFVSNGATLSSTSVGCEIYNAEESCSVTTPTITRSNYTIIGYNTSKDATTSQVGSNSKINISSDATYYAITSRTLTANFNKNTVSSISATSSNCTIYNEQTSCTPTLPTITAQTNFTSQNWGTSASQTSAGVTSITLTGSNTGSTWYALNSRTLSWNFNKNVVSSIGSTSQSCTIWSTSGTCNITTPTITPTSGYTQNGWGTATSSTSATIAVSTAKTLNNSTTGGTYYALQKKTITVTYAANGGTGTTSSHSCTMHNANTTCSLTLKTNGFTKTGSDFLGWGTTTSVVSHNASTAYNFSNNTTLNAIWKTYKCVRATTLHTETCTANTNPYVNISVGCTNFGGYADGDTITYGTLGTSSTLNSGDAFDCDVNGDGVYDAASERFYYISNLYNTTSKSFDNNYAVLIYYKNIYSGSASYSSSVSTTGPEKAISYLPTNTQWSNVSLSNTTRAIITKDGGNSVSFSTDTLPSEFSYAGYAARLLTYQELENACGNIETDYNFINCNYVLENTYYSSTSTKNGYWLETPAATAPNIVHTVSGTAGKISTFPVTNTGNEGDVSVRPVIEVKKTDIKY